MCNFVELSKWKNLCPVCVFSVNVAVVADAIVCTVLLIDWEILNWGYKWKIGFLIHGRKNSYNGDDGCSTELTIRPSRRGVACVKASKPSDWVIERQQRQQYREMTPTEKWIGNCPIKNMINKKTWLFKKL